VDEVLYIHQLEAGECWRKLVLQDAGLTGYVCYKAAVGVLGMKISVTRFDGVAFVTVAAVAGFLWLLLGGSVGSVDEVLHIHQPQAD
jgi:hypothetical protein